MTKAGLETPATEQAHQLTRQSAPIHWKRSPRRLCALRSTEVMHDEPV